MGGTRSLTALAVSPDGGETVETVSGRRPRTGTGLKPGVNEKNPVLDVLAGVFTQSRKLVGLHLNTALSSTSSAAC